MVLSGFLAVEPVDQLAMDLQIGIAPDRRGEVAVVLARQGIVRLGLGCVGGLLQAAQAARNGRRIPRDFRSSRWSTRCSSKRLCGWSIFSPRLRANSANSSSLNGSGSGCARRRKPISFSAECRGDRLVGRQHEFLDQLVALVMLSQMRAGDLPVAVRARSPPRAVRARVRRVYPAPAQDHRQLEHLTQHDGDLGVNAVHGAAGLLHDRKGLLVRETMGDLDRRPCESLRGQDALEGYSPGVRSP